MKTLPFTEKELDTLIYNARENYCHIIENIDKEEMVKFSLFYLLF